MMRERLDTIQALRAFAALAVVFYHSIEAVAHSYPDGTVPSAVMDLGWLGNFGADVFFVISGFIMVYAHYDDFAVPGSQRHFLSNRLRRIVPNYWLLTTVGALVLLLMPGLSQHGRTFDPLWIIASYLFIPWTSEAGIPMPVLGLGWTLNYEMYFYVVFSFALLFPKRLGFSLLALVFFVSIAAGTIFAPEGPLFKQITSWLLAEFLSGVALGVAFKNGRLIPTFPAVLLLSFTIPVLLASLGMRENGTLPQYLRFVFFGLPALAIVSAATLNETIRNLRVPAVVLLLGNASYALYLTHVFTLPFAQKVLSNLGLQIPFELTVVVLLGLAAVVAVIFYKLFERPSQRLLRPARKARMA